MGFTIETVVDTPVPETLVTVTTHTRTCSIPVITQPDVFDFTDAAEALDWLRLEVLKTETNITDTTFRAYLDDLVTPTKVIFECVWTPQLIT